MFHSALVSMIKLFQYFNMVCFFLVELNQAVLLTEYGNKRPEKVLRPKVEVIFNLAVEPNPVHG